MTVSGTTFVPEIMDTWVKMTAFTDAEVRERMVRLASQGPPLPGKLSHYNSDTNTGESCFIQ